MKVKLFGLISMLIGLIALSSCTYTTHDSDTYSISGLKVNCCHVVDDVHDKSYATKDCTHYVVYYPEYVKQLVVGMESKVLHIKRDTNNTIIYYPSETILILDMDENNNFINIK